MAKVKFTTEIELDTTVAAQWFCDLSDDEMADFLIKIAEISKDYQWNNQWYWLGGHLRNCKCSTPEVREMLKSWVHWMEHSEHT